MSESLLCSTVGLLSKVGEDEYRFSHLTLQEYLAAKHTVQIYGNDAQQLMDKLNLLQPDVSKGGNWNIEVSRFVAGMLKREVFDQFCQLILESDDQTGYGCELVEDFLKEQGSVQKEQGSQKVERILKKKVQEIRGTDFLIAGLCHPCPEIRRMVLHEMKKFCMPPNPVEDGTVPSLKKIAEDASYAWHVRAAAILSLAHIAQLSYWKSHQIDRAKTIIWMLKMQQSKADVLENVYFAFVKALGTLFEEGCSLAVGDGMMLERKDEGLLLELLPRMKRMTVANVLSDLKIFSLGLVNWIESVPSLIALGEWPIRHVHFLCENVAALDDSASASRLVGSLLDRLHSSSFKKTDRELLLKGLRAVQLPATGNLWEHALQFLESGDAEQRARVLAAIVEMKVRLEGEYLISRLAKCLQLDAPRKNLHDHASEGISLLAYVLEKEKRRYKDSSFRNESAIFLFLVQSIAQISGDGQHSEAQVVLSELLKEESSEEKESSEEDEEEEGRQEQADGDVTMTVCGVRDYQEHRKQDDQTEEGKQEERHEEAVPHKEEMEEEEEGEGGERRSDGIQRKQKQKDRQEEQEVSVEGLAAMVRKFTPSMLIKGLLATHNKADQVHLYIAALVWGETGLCQEVSSNDVATWLHLSSSESAQAASLLKALKTFTDPWVKGNAEIDGAWDQTIRDSERFTLSEIVQTRTLGRVLFGYMLMNTRDSIRDRLTGSMTNHLWQESTVSRWFQSRCKGHFDQHTQIEYKQQRLEQHFLLKEFWIGSRSVELPVWAGLVSTHPLDAKQETFLPKIDAILKPMRAHHARADVQEQGCGALRNFAVNDQNRAKVAEAGGIEAVVGAMRGHPEVANVQEQGCGALRNLAVIDRYKTKVAEAGGIEAVVGAMGGHPEVADVQEQGCGVLCLLAAMDDNHAEIAAAGGVEVMVNAIICHPEVAGVQEQGCEALRHLGELRSLLSEREREREREREGEACGRG